MAAWDGFPSIKNDMSQALKELKLAATTTKKDAKERLMPTSRMEAREKVNLTYTNSAFYAMLLKIEAVYHTLLKQENVALFGVGIVGDIGFTLEAFGDAIGFSQFLSDAVDEETKAEVP